MTGDRPTGDTMDRYVRGELSPAEARELAQASLDSPELFEELGDAAVAKAALHSATLPGESVVPFPGKLRRIVTVAAGVAAAAAAVLLIWLAVARPWRTATPHVQPLLVAGGLQLIPTERNAAPVFRGSETDSRAPRTAGSIVAIEDGMATIDLGSLDGLDKGSEVQIYRDDRPTETIGRLQVITVFREHARGRIIDGRELRVKDQVRIDDAAHLAALMEQVDALYNRGDADAAYRMAEQVSQWAETANVPPATQAAWWNQLGALRMLRGDYRNAEASLNRAAAHNSGLTYAESMNNLGALDELRGRPMAAKVRYAAAVEAFAGIPDAPEHERRAAQTNLARVRGSH